jgi:hypothetical protein
VNNAHSQATPPPVAQPRPEPAAPERRAAPAAAPAAAAAAAQAGGQQGANFRETLWFKKGDVEQMVAEAKAKAAGVRTETPSGSHDVPVEDAKPLEDRYVDDGSVTVEDRKKFSLRAGATSAGVPVVGGAMPGERMSDAEMINEIGGKRTRVIAFAGVAVVAVIAVLFFTFKGKGEKPAAVPAAAPSPAAMAKTADEPPAAPKAAEPQAPATAPAEAPAEPAHAKEAAPAREPAQATAKARSAKRKPPKHTSGKKKR